MFIIIIICEYYANFHQITHEEPSSKDHEPANQRFQQINQASSGQQHWIIHDDGSRNRWHGLSSLL
jgi:hypothetical protein